MGFNPNEHMMKLKDKDYLQVAWRLVWFREDHPDWSIDTVPLAIDADHAVFKAVINDENGLQKSAGHGSESKRDFGDFIEKAETKAVGRALAMLGYGTQFAADELDEGERIVDTPVKRANDDTPQTPEERRAEIEKSRQGAQNAPTGKARVERRPIQNETQEDPRSLPATEEQKKYIETYSSDEDYAKIMERYGAELETMSQYAAQKVIEQIKANNARAAGVA